MNQKLSIEQYFDTYQQNFNRFKENFPVTFRAANEINELFWQLYDSYILPQQENSWQYVAHEMLFGCLTGWINSFINSASGLDETAQTSGRRAIEFVCYIAKIRGNDNRADLWIRQRESEETRKQFVQEFSVPGCYFSDNYSRLEKLLFLYESFSIFGTHANISMLALKKKETGTSFEDIVFDEYRYIPKNVDNIIYLGYLLIQSLLSDLSDLINDQVSITKRFNEIKSITDLSNAEIMMFEAISGIEPEIINMLLTNPTIFKTKYEQLKQSYINRKKK